MKLQKLLEMFRIDEFTGLGGFSPPDNTGIRSKGLDRKPDRRLGNFPYDKDVSYGNPANYDRGNRGGSNLNRPLTPKDDDGFSLKLLDREMDDIEEAIGTPINFGQSNKSGNMSSQMGASATGWSRNPPREWDESELEEDFDPETPEIEEPPHSDLPDFHFETDDDLKNKFDRIYNREDNLNFVDPAKFAKSDSHMIGSDPWKIIADYLNSRKVLVIPQQSAWDRVGGMAPLKREF